MAFREIPWEKLKYQIHMPGYSGICNHVCLLCAASITRMTDLLSRLFNLLSVYFPVYISELTWTKYNSVPGKLFLNWVYVNAKKWLFITRLMLPFIFKDKVLGAIPPTVARSLRSMNCMWSLNCWCGYWTKLTKNQPNRFLPDRTYFARRCMEKKPKGVSYLVLRLFYLVGKQACLALHDSHRHNL